jgi:nicotinamidase-related amidase
MLARADDSVLVVVDMQPTFLAPIFERDRVKARTKFLIHVAKILDIPILATEQYPERMGGTDPELTALLDHAPLPKLAFSCMGCEPFSAMLGAQDRPQVVICGIETHICVNQTAHDLLDDDYEVLLAADACSARSSAMHDNGLQRLRDEGAAIAHSESIVYEWMQSADHPEFRAILKLVKDFAG